GLGAVALAGCSAEAGPREGAGHDGAHVLAESPAAQARVAALRAQFRIAPRTRGEADPLRRLHPWPSKPLPVLGAGVVERFEAGDHGWRAVVHESARRGVQKRARVELPARADGAVRVTDETSGMGVAFALEGARAVSGAAAEGLVVYEGALGGGVDVVHRAHAEGTEDYLVFERRPDREELRYRVDVSTVAGLRLVSNVLEFLDAEGTPRLRVGTCSAEPVIDSRSKVVLGVRPTRPSAASRCGTERCRWDERRGVHRATSRRRWHASSAAL
ncbi:MAG TPA: hypothetical protein VMP89_17575, partial [Solirubrobacteraceae bacterium]|nr:hypothetical protein [Solirubrobacteraceae bacterium]